MATRGSVPLVLASSSEQRRALLEQAGHLPDLMDPAGLDETPEEGESPHLYAMRMAREKVARVAERHPDALVLGADTVAACGRRILPVTDDRAVAGRNLLRLSGRSHRVWGAVVVRTPDQREARRLVLTRVRFRRLCEAEIRDYLDSGEWRGKAGSYAIQGRATVFVRSLNGSYTNVVGLPLTETEMLLRGLGRQAPAT